MTREEAVRDLLIDWVHTRCFEVGEFSSTFREDYGALLAEAHERAGDLEVPCGRLVLP